MRETTVSHLKPALLDALSAILPSPQQTWLLRACLHSGETGRQAWEVYQGRVSDPKTDLKNPRLGGKTLVPLLLTALQRNGIAVDRSLLPYLKTALLREELRSKTYRSILRDALFALSIKGIPHIVLKAAALAETVYAEPALRHCDDISILLKQDDVLPAATLLYSCGFTPERKELGPGVRPFTLMHESGLPLHLHRSLFCIPHYSVPLADLWARSRTQAIAGIPTRILSPADNLLHVCIQAFAYSRRESPRWASDAWHIIVVHPAPDWDVMVDCAKTNHLGLQLYLTLRYLADDLHAPIPSIVLDRLRDAASQTDRIRGEVAIATALTGARDPLSCLARMRGGWRARALVAKWVFLPSSRYMRAAYPVRSSWLLPLWYLVRLPRYAARRIWWRCKGSAKVKELQKHLRGQRAARKAPGKLGGLFDPKGSP